MVTRIYSFLKSHALSLLPDSVLQPLRVWHHRRVLGSFPDTDEPDLAVVRELVRRGAVAVDLGANFGMYTKDSFRPCRTERNRHQCRTGGSDI